MKQEIFIDYPDVAWGKTLKKIVTILTYVSILVIVLGSYIPKDSAYFHYIIISEFIFSFLFFLDYFIRLYYSNFSRKFIRNGFSITDVLSFMPLFIGIAGGFLENIQILNIFRLCRVLRIFRVGKYMSFLKEIWKAVKKNLYKYRIAFTLFFIVWLIGSFLVYSVENLHNPKFATIPDAMRWAIVTMGTVGYGDIYPTTILGKIIASVIIVFGPIFLSIITSITIITFLDVFSFLKKDEEIEYVCGICFTGGHKDSDNYCRSCGKRLNKDI